MKDFIDLPSGRLIAPDKISLIAPGAEGATEHALLLIINGVEHKVDGRDAHALLDYLAETQDLEIEILREWLPRKPESISDRLRRELEG